MLVSVARQNDVAIEVIRCRNAGAPQFHETDRPPLQSSSTRPTMGGLFLCERGKPRRCFQVNSCLPPVRRHFLCPPLCETIRHVAKRGKPKKHAPSNPRVASTNAGTHGRSDDVDQRAEPAPQLLAIILRHTFHGDSLVLSRGCVACREPAHEPLERTIVQLKRTLANSVGPFGGLPLSWIHLDPCAR